MDNCNFATEPIKDNGDMDKRKEYLTAYFERPFLHINNACSNCHHFQDGYCMVNKLPIDLEYICEYYC